LNKTACSTMINRAWWWKGFSNSASPYPRKRSGSTTTRSGSSRSRSTIETRIRHSLKDRDPTTTQRRQTLVVVG